MEKKAKILLIDDDPDFVEVTRKVLERKPYQVVVAVNGKDGLEKAKKEKPDLILLDILMPVTDGFGFAEKFGKEKSLSAIPVLALTSFSTSLGEPFGFSVAEYIRKPIGPSDLIDKVEKHLKRAEEKAMAGVAKGGAKKRKAQAKTVKKPAKKATKAATKKTRK